MNRKLLRIFAKLASHATTLALIGFFGVVVAVSTERIDLALIGVAVLAVGRLAQIEQIRRFEKKRHQAEVRSKYEKLVAEHWKLTAAPESEPNNQYAASDQSSVRSAPRSEA